MPDNEQTETMSDSNDKREIPIRDDNEPAEEKHEQQGDKTVMPGSAAANVYRKQAGDEKPNIPEPEPAEEPEEPEVEEKVQATKADKKAEELQAIIDDLRDKNLRLHAEFDNFRKRTERERLLTISRASSAVMEDLLPVLDNFRLALNAGGSTGESFRTGIEMINKQLNDVASRHGLERIKAEGEHFDPNFHEALISEPSADHEEGTVIEVLQEGYTLRGSVLRPARVKVAAAPPEPTEGKDD